MALLFQLWIETGHDDTKGMAIRNYFNAKKEIITDMGHYPIKVYKSEDTASIITVNGISQTGMHSQKDCEEMTQIGFEFYEHLRKVPTFRYALCGIEVDEWREMSELEEDPDDILLIKGFVIRKDLYNLLGSPGEMIPFTTNYVWTPYEGEVWDPT